MIKILYSTLTALTFLHELNIMHRDLKSANILVQADCNVKICDYGLSRTMPQCCTDEYSINSIKVRTILNSFLGTKNNQIKVDLDPSKQITISSFLTDDKSRRKRMKRCMSIHVGSRWYRAPEVSLVEKQYD